MLKKKLSHFGFHLIKKFLHFFYPTPQICGTLPDEPCIVVGNHSQIHGPIICELFFPEKFKIWCAGAMMHLKDVPQYAFSDFWSQKPKYTHPYYKLCSYLIAPLSTFLFNQAHTIAVYRDARILSTFKKTVRALQDGENVIIFPEHDQKHNHIVYAFEENFVDVARLYQKRTGTAPLFVPMYIAPRLHRICFGTPIRFSPDAPIAEERTQICHHLMQEITDMAEALPLHTVIPYRNIPKKYYPKNKEVS